MNYIICMHNIYHVIEDYILSFINIIHAELKIIDNNFDIDFLDSNNYIFIQSFPSKLLSKINNNLNIYIINTEQLSFPEKRHISGFPNKNINIIDYAYANFNYYNLLVYKQKFLLPYQVNYNEIFNINKINDICLIGDRIPPYRQTIINLLKNKNINVDIISGFGKNRDKLLFKYKILLNISYNQNFNIFESIRCDRCVYNKIIIISDLKENIDEHYLRDYIIFEKYENIPDKVSDVINNYEYYYNKIFKNFNLDNISIKIKEDSKEIIDILTK